MMSRNDPIAKAMRREDRMIDTAHLGYFVQLNVKPYQPGERFVWPRLFDTRREAEDFMRASGGLFAQNVPGRRVVSAAVQHVRRAHGFGREVPNMGATDQPTRTTTTNIEPSAASAKPGESS